MKDQDPDYADLGEASENHRRPHKLNVRKISSIIDKEFSQEISLKETEALEIQERLHRASKTLHLLRYAIVSNFYNNRHCLASNSVESKQSQIHPAVKKLIGRRHTVDHTVNRSTSVGCDQNVMMEYDGGQSGTMDFKYGTHDKMTMENGFEQNTSDDNGGLDYEAKFAEVSQLSATNIQEDQWVLDPGCEVNCSSVTGNKVRHQATNNAECNFDTSVKINTKSNSSRDVQANSNSEYDIKADSVSMVKMESICDSMTESGVNDNVLIDTEMKFDLLKDATSNRSTLKRSQPSSPPRPRKMPRYIPPNDSVVGPRSPSRGLHHKTRRRIVIGNISKWLPPEWREDSATHKWTMYVRGSEECPSIDNYIAKVRFFLHPSYRPNDVVEITSPPFYLSRRGWGEFPLRVQLHFKSSSNKPMDIIHHLKLDRTYTGLQTLGSETLVDVWLNSEHAHPKRNMEIPSKTDLNSRICDPIEWIVKKENVFDEGQQNFEKISKTETQLGKSDAGKNVDTGHSNNESKGKMDVNNDTLRYYVDLDHDYLGSRCPSSGDSKDNVTVRHEVKSADLTKGRLDRKLESFQPLEITIPSLFESHENKRLVVLRDNKSTHSVTIRGLNLDPTKLKGDKRPNKGISLLRKDVGRGLKINRGNSVILNMDSNIPALKIAGDWSSSHKVPHDAGEYAGCSMKKDNIDSSVGNKGQSFSNKGIMGRDGKINEIKNSLLGAGKDGTALNINLFDEERSGETSENSVLVRKEDDNHFSIDSSDRKADGNSTSKEIGERGNTSSVENGLAGEDLDDGTVDNGIYEKIEIDEAESLNSESNYYYNHSKYHTNFEAKLNSNLEIQNPSNSSNYSSNYPYDPSKSSHTYTDKSQFVGTDPSNYQEIYEKYSNPTYVLNEKLQRPKTILGKDKTKPHSNHNFQDLISLIKSSKIDDFEKLLRFVIKRVPIVTKESIDSDYKRAYPFSCVSKDQFLNLNLGKRAAIEWNRAKLILDLIKLKLSNQKLWNIKEILIWARLHGHTPLCKISKIPKTMDFGEIQNPGLSEFKHWVSNSYHLNSNLYEEEIDIIKAEDEKKILSREKRVLNIEENNVKSLLRNTSQQNIESKMMMVELENGMEPLHRFVCETSREIGITLVCEDILPNVAYPASSRMIMQAVKCLVDDILRLSLAQAWQRQSSKEYPKSISLIDVQRGLLNREEFDMFSNLGLSSRYID